jgi:hypothetical protein
MTYEARLAFVLFFFAIWLFFGLMAWASVAVIKRGRGALIALPAALLGAALAGVAVPLIVAQDGAAFVLSILTSTAGGFAGAIAGTALAIRTGITQAPIDDSRRPEREDAASTESTTTQ